MTLDGVALSPALGIGAFAEKTLVAAGQCTKVSSAVKPEVAGLLGCGVMAGIGAAMLTGEVGPGDSVAVFGCGGVGVAAASSFIELRSAGQSADALMSSIGQVLIATGALSVLFVPIVTWLGRMKAKVLAAE
jgi:Zn-dependent alcohol dehydrogenase